MITLRFFYFFSILSLATITNIPTSLGNYQFTLLDGYTNRDQLDTHSFYLLNDILVFKIKKTINIINKKPHSCDENYLRKNLVLELLPLGQEIVHSFKDFTRSLRIIPFEQSLFFKPHRPYSPQEKISLNSFATHFDHTLLFFYEDIFIPVSLLNTFFQEGHNVALRLYLDCIKKNQSCSSRFVLKNILKYSKQQFKKHPIYYPTHAYAIFKGYFFWRNLTSTHALRYRSPLYKKLIPILTCYKNKWKLTSYPDLRFYIDNGLDVEINRPIFLSTWPFSSRLKRPFPMHLKRKCLALKKYYDTHFKLPLISCH